MPEPVRPLLFLHLPKTAGTTLKSIIDRVYEGRKIAFLKVHRGELEAFAARPREERASYDVVGGHLNWGERGVLPGAAVLTMLRDPVERVISWYHYNRTNENADLHAMLNERGLTLEDMIRRRMLVRVGNQMVDMLRDRDTRDGRSALASAKANLASCAAFGLSERFSDSIRHFGEALGWPETAWEDKNVSSGRGRAEDLDPRALAQLRRDCAADIQLYDHARRLFDERIA